MSSLRASLVRNMGARTATLPVSAVCGLATVGMTIHHVGPSRYGAIAVIATLVLFTPMLDLGISAAVTNALSDVAGRFDIALPLIRGSFRLLILAGSAVAVVCGVISLAHGWPSLLGDGAAQLPNLNGTMAVVGFIFGAAVPLGIGARILLGLDRQHLVTYTSLIGPLATLGATATIGLLNLGEEFYALTPPIGLCLQLVVQTVIASRLVGCLIRSWVAGPTGDGAYRLIAGTAWPMFILMVGTPVALQSHRIIISHVRPDALDVYSLAAQLYQPAWSIVSAGALALWPLFSNMRRQRSGHEVRRLYLEAVTSVGVVAVFLAGALFLLGGLVANIVSSGRIVLPGSLLLCFGGLLVVQGVQYTGGTFLTRPNELRIQAYGMLALAPISVAGSIFFARLLGAVGPVIAMIIAYVTCLIIPAAVRIMRCTPDCSLEGGPKLVTE